MSESVLSEVRVSRCCNSNPSAKEHTCAAKIPGTPTLVAASWRESCVVRPNTPRAREPTWRNWVIACSICGILAVSGCKDKSPRVLTSSQRAVVWCRESGSQLVDIRNAIVNYHKAVGAWPSDFDALVRGGWLPSPNMEVREASKTSAVTPIDGSKGRWEQRGCVAVYFGEVPDTWGTFPTLQALAIVNPPAVDIPQVAILLDSGDIVFLTEMEYADTRTEWKKRLGGFGLWGR